MYIHTHIYTYAHITITMYHATKGASKHGLRVHTCRQAWCFLKRDMHAWIGKLITNSTTSTHNLQY